MKLSDYIGMAKRILKESAGSEGFVYKITTKNSLPKLDNETLKILDHSTDNGQNIARVEFAVPRDPGFAANTLKAMLGDIEIIALELIY